MPEIDFLPAEYWKRRASERDQWYLLGIGAASLILLLASVVHESSNAAQLRSQLEGLDSDYNTSRVDVEQIRRLEERIAPLAFDAKLLSLLRARPSLARGMVALATSCPAQLSLTSVRIKPARDTRANPKTAGATPKNTPPSSATGDTQLEQLEQFATDRSVTRLTIDLTGVAESDLEVAELIERLENAGCFADVTLDSTVSESSGSPELREFKIHCRIVEVF